VLSALADLVAPLRRESFLKLLAREFYPALRSEGFQGSGATLRRVRYPIVHVVNLQGSDSGKEFYVNLGAHPLFLPTEGGGIPSAPDRIDEAACAFRDRIDPPGEARRWSYRRTAVASLAREWEGQGRPFFAKYWTFPDDFVALVKASAGAPPDSYEALKHARIALHLGLRDEALVLARSALATVGPVATTLEANVERFLEELTESGRAR
jgi:hypothetical protein